MIRNMRKGKTMKKVLMCVVALVVCASASFATVGDTWNAFQDYDWPTAADGPWSYVAQEGAVRNGFGNMVGMITYEVNDSEYGYISPTAPYAYGPLCGLFARMDWSCMLMQSSQVVPDGWQPGQAFIGFTAPEAGEYLIEGNGTAVSGYPTTVTNVICGNDGKGLLWSGTSTEGVATFFNFTAGLAAGETVYFGQDIVTPAEWIVYKSVPLALTINVTQTSDVVPEPASLMVMASGVVGLLGFARRRRS
ncbi:MAG: PEP-CTERM sorting domain-containing protein [Armatimonadota bacterium]